MKIIVKEKYIKLEEKKMNADIKRKLRISKKIIGKKYGLLLTILISLIIDLVAYLGILVLANALFKPYLYIAIKYWAFMLISLYIPSFILTVFIIYHLYAGKPLRSAQIERIKEHGLTHFTSKEAMESIIQMQHLMPTKGKMAYSVDGEGCVFFFIGNQLSSFQISTNNFKGKDGENYIKILDVDSLISELRYRIFNDVVIYMNPEGLNLSELKVEYYMEEESRMS